MSDVAIVIFTTLFIHIHQVPLQVLVLLTCHCFSFLYYNTFHDWNKQSASWVKMFCFCNEPTLSERWGQKHLFMKCLYWVTWHLIEEELLTACRTDQIHHNTGLWEWSDNRWSWSVYILYLVFCFIISLKICLNVVVTNKKHREESVSYLTPFTIISCIHFIRQWS